MTTDRVHFGQREWDDGHGKGPGAPAIILHPHASPKPGSLLLHNLLRNTASFHHVKVHPINPFSGA